MTGIISLSPKYINYKVEQQIRLDLLYCTNQCVHLIINTQQSYTLDQINFTYPQCLCHNTFILCWKNGQLIDYLINRKWINSSDNQIIIWIFYQAKSQKRWLQFLKYENLLLLSFLFKQHFIKFNSDQCQTKEAFWRFQLSKW